MPVNVVVVGSLNMDLVTTAPVTPKQGETILGNEFNTNPGGKGANQAVAAARLGANVDIIGCVGNDTFGAELIDNLDTENVSTTGIDTVDNVSTGIASITITEGDNRIIVVPGANDYLTPERVHNKKELIENADIMLLQLEVPLPAIEEAVQIAKINNVTIILNPAPIKELPDSILSDIDWFTPNEHEMEIFTKNTPNHSKHLQKFIVTRGKEGLTFHCNNQLTKVSAYKVSPLDTTGAGDTFNGALAVALKTEKNVSLENACLFANAAAALSTTKVGAQSGMPNRKEVEKLIKTNSMT
ncbi:ribokinase [Salibacterium salarium]|uniref:Ribokinase n=1 Tax=Salibacterium salarium TaxID=284579 RepID=A0A3R9QUC4_9BACI|nr:ribokinase [Salibacterium salarium]RSL33642.1 ribokinase [Salibacterium salarium]